MYSAFNSPTAKLFGVFIGIAIYLSLAIAMTHVSPPIYTVGIQEISDVIHVGRD